MATLSQGPRLNARTTRRIHGLVKQLGIACSSQGLTFQGRDISSEAIISAVLLEMLELPQKDQVEFLRIAFRKLEQELTDQSTP